jgi:hypothetical protein
MKKWLVSVLLCLSSVAAHASLITIDPENYAPARTSVTRSPV